MPILGYPVSYLTKIEPCSCLSHLVSTLTSQVTLPSTPQHNTVTGDSFCTVLPLMCVFICAHCVYPWSTRDGNDWRMPHALFINSTVQALWHFHALCLSTWSVCQNLGHTVLNLSARDRRTTGPMIITTNAQDVWSKALSWDWPCRMTGLRWGGFDWCQVS